MTNRTKQGVVTMRRWMLLTVAWMSCLTMAAQDFLCQTREGRQLHFAELPKDRMTLLMFYDPDCSDCRQELFEMRHSSLLRQTIAKGEVQVLCVYAEENEALWRETAGELPDTWTVAIARTDIKSLQQYDLSAMPVFYLYDTSGKVVATDNYFQTISLKLRACAPESH